jgi:hypothetical protein
MLVWYKRGINQKCRHILHIKASTGEAVEEVEILNRQSKKIKRNQTINLLGN